jgi:broad specificity phosphatase PhoE
VFLRHGESAANAAGVVSGWDDVPLTPRGEAQARSAGIALAAGAPLRHAVTSDLRRAHHTASGALAALAEAGSPAPALQVEGRLRERNLGRWQGRPYAQLRETGESETLVSWGGRPPGGESNADLAWRVLGALADLEDRLGRGAILVVAHGGVIRAVLGLLDGVPRDALAKAHIPNARPLSRAVAPGTWAALMHGL